MDPDEEENEKEQSSDSGSPPTKKRSVTDSQQLHRRRSLRTQALLAKQAQAENGGDSAKSEDDHEVPKLATADTESAQRSQVVFRRRISSVDEAQGSSSASTPNYSEENTESEYGPESPSLGEEEDDEADKEKPAKEDEKEDKSIASEEEAAGTSKEKKQEKEDEKDDQISIETEQKTEPGTTKEKEQGPSKATKADQLKLPDNPEPQPSTSSKPGPSKTTKEKVKSPKKLQDGASTNGQPGPSSSKTTAEEPKPPENPEPQASTSATVSVKLIKVPLCVSVRRMPTSTTREALKSRCSNNEHQVVPPNITVGRDQSSNLQELMAREGIPDPAKKQTVTLKFSIVPGPNTLSVLVPKAGSCGSQRSVSTPLPQMSLRPPPNVTITPGFPGSAPLSVLIPKNIPTKRCVPGTEPFRMQDDIVPPNRTIQNRSAIPRLPVQKSVPVSCKLEATLQAQASSSGTQQTPRNTITRPGLVDSLAQMDKEVPPNMSIGPEPVPSSSSSNSGEGAPRSSSSGTQPASRNRTTRPGLVDSLALIDKEVPPNRTIGPESSSISSISSGETPFVPRFVSGNEDFVTQISYDPSTPKPTFKDILNTSEQIVPPNRTIEPGFEFGFTGSHPKPAPKTTSDTLSVKVPRGVGDLAQARPLVTPPAQPASSASISSSSSGPEESSKSETTTTAEIYEPPKQARAKFAVRKTSSISSSSSGPEESSKSETTTAEIYEPPKQFRSKLALRTTSSISSSSSGPEESSKSETTTAEIYEPPKQNRFKVPLSATSSSSSEEVPLRNLTGGAVTRPSVLTRNPAIASLMLGSSGSSSSMNSEDVPLVPLKKQNEDDVQKVPSDAGDGTESPESSEL